MEGIIFIGIQGSGKSTFYIQKFFNSHIRISLDLLKTRNREKKILQTSLETSAKIVIDNTNPTTSDRAKYIESFKEYKYKVIGYYFESKIKDCMERNKNRLNPIPEKGVLATYNKLHIPEYNEGFDELYYIKIEGNEFIVEEWKNEI